MSSDCPSLFFFLSPASDCVSPTLSAWWSGVLLPSKGARRPRFVHGSVLRVWQNYETLHYGGFIQYISLQSGRNTHPSRKVMASKVPLVSEAPPALLRWGWERVRRMNLRDLIRQITLCLDVQAGTQRDMTVIRRVSSRQVFCWTNMCRVMSWNWSLDSIYIRKYLPLNANHQCYIFLPRTVKGNQIYVLDFLQQHHKASDFKRGTLRCSWLW